MFFDTLTIIHCYSACNTPACPFKEDCAILIDRKQPKLAIFNLTLVYFNELSLRHTIFFEYVA